MNPVEFSELESVSLSLWAEIQTVKKSVEAQKSGGGGCSCDCASIREEFAKMNGIINGGFLFINIKGVIDINYLEKFHSVLENYKVGIDELHTYTLSINYKKYLKIFRIVKNAVYLKKICKMSSLNVNRLVRSYNLISNSYRSCNLFSYKII